MRPDQEEFFTVLYREYFNQIKLYAMAHISDPHRAEEIAQDTFHTAVEKIDTLMKADEPIRWLKRTAKNKIRNEQRTRQRYLKRYLSLDAPETPAVSSAGSVEDAIIEQEDKQQRASVEETIRQTLTPTEITMLKRIAIERACRLGGRDRAPGALKQPHAVMLLQFPDGNAQRRLRQMQLLRRARHTAAAVDRCEDFHVPQRQDFPALSYKIFHMIRIS